MFQKRLLKRVVPCWKRKAARKIILPSKVQKQITEISENLSKHFDKNKRILLIGSHSQTTFTSQVLDSVLYYPMFRIDLSSVISKYIGETEKNLEKVFAKAESKDWILLFDEADVLFGKRTEVSDAHDKYENLEVSWLLQRVEEYAGLLILASNLKDEPFDEAFTRRLKIKTIIQTEEDEDEEN